jgi:MOSC domain-containing protein YiiM
MRAGLQRKLQGRRGQLASIVTGGTVRVGDEVRMA